MRELPLGARFMSNMIKPEVVQDHAIPVILIQFPRNVSSHIVVNFCEILKNRAWLSFVHEVAREEFTNRNKET